MTLINAIRYGVSEEEYRADPCNVPALSQSTALTLLECPALAFREHPKLGGKSRKPSKDMDRGSLIDELLFSALENRPAMVAVVDAKDWRTTAAKEARDAIRSSGKTPALPKELSEAESVVKILRDKMAVKGIELDGESQVTVLWSVDSSFGPVQCRGRLDHLTVEDGKAIIYDLKTTGRLTPRSRIGAHFVEFGYDIQSAAYTQAVERLLPQYAGRVEFRNILLELDGVNRVRDVRPSGMMLELGQKRWGRACDVWAACLLSGEWPDGDDGIIRVSPPAWAMAQEEASDDEEL